MNNHSFLICLLLLLSILAACFNPATTSPRELTAHSTGVKLYTRVAGNPASGNVLIAIHGGPGMTSDYMLSLEKLAGPHLAVVTYDQRGVGRSSSPVAVPASYTLVNYADDLDAVRAALNAKKIILFGHSWGGVVAQQYAALYPGRVSSLILMGSGPPTREQTLQCQEAIVQRIYELVEQGIISMNPDPGSPEAEKSYLPAYFSDPNFWFSPDDPGSAPQIDERTNQVNGLTWAANAYYDLTAGLTGVNQRVLNLWGADDPSGGIASPAIIAALPNADLETVVLNHCGHFWQECPDQFFAVMRRFLGIEF